MQGERQRQLPGEELGRVGESDSVEDAGISRHKGAIMAVAAASLANLMPAWENGKSGNPAPAAAPNLGQSVIGWMNTLGKLPREAIRKASLDESAPISKRMAANSLLRANRRGFAKNGRPWAADDLDRQLDRTVGKPAQRVEVVRTEVRDPRALMIELAKVLADAPELVKSLGLSLGGVLQEGAYEGGGAPNDATESG